MKFTYLASHDLQEPLRKLVSFSEFLQADLGPDITATITEDIHFITDAAYRMQTLVQDLLQFSRSSRGEMKLRPTNLEECLNNALDVWSLKIQETGAQIERDPLPMVFGDKTLLTQVYQNLIGNALKFVEH